MRVQAEATGEAEEGVCGGGGRARGREEDGPEVHKGGVVQWEDGEGDEYGDDVRCEDGVGGGVIFFGEGRLDRLGEGAAERGFFVVGNQGGGDGEGAGGFVGVFEVGGGGELFAFERATERAVELFDTSSQGKSEFDSHVLFVLFGFKRLSKWSANIDDTQKLRKSHTNLSQKQKPCDPATRQKCCTDQIRQRILPPFHPRNSSKHARPAHHRVRQQASQHRPDNDPNVETHGHDQKGAALILFLNNHLRHHRPQHAHIAIETSSENPERQRCP